MNKILIVDDDPNIRELISVLLRNENFEVYEASDGVEALEEIEKRKVDIVILDIMMPNMDGWKLCEELRKNYEMPVLMVTAKGENHEKIKGFKLGTDDYLVKPFDRMELVMRVRALLRRYKIAESNTLKVGELIMNSKDYEVIAHGKNLILPLKEFELLFKLANHCGKTLSRDQLIEDIWGYSFDGNERTLDVHINRLRDRFPEDKYSFRIKTIRGLGYRLEVDS